MSSNATIPKPHRRHSVAGYRPSRPPVGQTRLVVLYDDDGFDLVRVPVSRRFAADEANPQPSQKASFPAPGNPWWSDDLPAELPDEHRQEARSQDTIWALLQNRAKS